MKLSPLQTKYLLLEAVFNMDKTEVPLIRQSRTRIESFSRITQRVSYY